MRRITRHLKMDRAGLGKKPDLAPCLIGLFALLSLAAGPPVQRDGAISTLRLFPHQISAQQQAAQWPFVQAQSALVADLDTNQVLLAKEADEPRPMASTTKIMTALLALEQGQPDEAVTVPAAALTVGGSSMYLSAGETLTLEDLLYGLLLPSANDAAVTIAIHIAGSEEAFVDLMNRRAAELGLTQTHFANAHGLDEPGHYASARDLYTLTRAAFQFPLFAQIVATVSYEAAGHTLTNSNEMLTLDTASDGVKTGTTDEAGECLVASVNQGGHRTIVVILGSTQRYADAQTLLAHYRAYYGWIMLAAPENALNRARDRSGEWRFLTTGPAPTAFVPSWQRAWVQPLRERLADDNDQPGAPAGVVHFLQDDRELGTQPLLWGAY